VNGQISSSVHSALEYIISKAMLEGKVGETTLEIPMTDMISAYEGPRFKAESASLVLKLQIKTSWSEGSPDGDLEVDVEGDIGFDDQIDDGEDDNGLG